MPVQTADGPCRVVTFPLYSLPLVGARNRLQDFPLPECRSDGVPGRAAEVQIQTGHSGGLRVVRTPSPEGNHGQDARCNRNCFSELPL